MHQRQWDINWIDKRYILPMVSLRISIYVIYSINQYYNASKTFDKDNAALAIRLKGSENIYNVYHKVYSFFHETPPL
jgi:hypothetical protein